MTVDLTELPEVARALELHPDKVYLLVMGPTAPAQFLKGFHDHLLARGLTNCVVIGGMDDLRVYEIALGHPVARRLPAFSEPESAC